MQATGSFSHQLTITLAADMKELMVHVPEPAAYTAFGASANVNKLDVVASPEASERGETTDSNGNRYITLTYDAPLPSSVTVTSTYSNVSVLVDLKPSLPGNTLPLTNLPSDVAPYLAPSDLAQSDNPQIKALAAMLTAKAKDEAEAAQALAVYEQSSLQDSPPEGSLHQDAAEVLAQKTGSPLGWSHLFIALARASGIPARLVDGTLVAGTLDIPAKQSSNEWVEESYTAGKAMWPEIWFPNAGWVAYEPDEQTLGFVNCLHVPERIGKDYSDFLSVYEWRGKRGLPPVEPSETYDCSGIKTKTKLDCTAQLKGQSQIYFMSRRMDLPATSAKH